MRIWSIRLSKTLWALCSRFNEGIYQLVFFEDYFADFYQDKIEIIEDHISNIIDRLNLVC